MFINNSVVTIQAALGVLGFILVFSGLLEASFEFNNIDSRPARCYLLTCSNRVMGNFIRVSGYFDEPGALAYWGIFALIFNKLFFGNKKIEAILLVSLVFTFSAAYFIQASFYLLFFCLKGKKSRIYMLLLLLVLYGIYDIFGNNEAFQYMTVERFEGGSIRSERGELATIAKKYFLESPIMGIGAQNSSDITYMADNQYEILAKDGIIGFIVTYLPLLFILFKYVKVKKIVFSCIILCLGYYQRPFHINEIHFLVLYMFLLMTITYNRRFKDARCRI